MTSISATGYLDQLSGTKSTTSTTTAKTQNGALDQSAFLKLMTTQLRTQDPTNPVDNTQMVAQMAQFSQVAGIAEMNASLKTMATDLAASRIGDASSWIGRAALLPSDIAVPVADGAFGGEVALPEAASNVSVSFTDASGAVVHQEVLGSQAAGGVPFSWDGRGEDGTAVPGPLRISVSASNAAGTAALDTQISTWAPVTGVQSPASGATRLVTALGLFNPADAQRLG